jgi:hypothetical protein
MNLYLYPHWNHGDPNPSNPLQRLNTESSKQIFPEKEMRGHKHNPDSYIHVSVSDLFILTIGLPILLQENSFFCIFFWRARVCWPLLCYFAHL